MVRPPVRFALLGVIVVVAIALRCYGLGSAGFSEDEISKLQAIDAYRHLDFTANAEHPMLMKLLASGSIAVSNALNHAVLAQWGLGISLEAALRFPNAVAGGLTTMWIFLLAELFFGDAVAWTAAVLWAFDVSAIAISRIGKEDSLLVLFLLLAAWCYERGKQAASNPGEYSTEGQRWFRAAGAAFGLMAAAKYMPYFFGLHVVFCRAADPNPGLNRPDKARYFGAMALTFLAANFAVLLPHNWIHIGRYTTEQLLPHTGYVFNGALYVNQISATPWGVPTYFYLEYILTKTPLPVLAAIVAGLFVTFRNPRQRGFVFLRVFLVFVLLPYSLLATKFVRYLLPVFVVLDMMAAVGVAWICRALFAWSAPVYVRRAVAAAACTIVLASPVAAVAHAAPFYALYQNAISPQFARDRLLFPHCELYDAGMREAARLVAQRAGAGAVVLSEAPRVVSYYAHRRDLVSGSVAHDGIPSNASEVWVLVQDGRLYMENLPLILQLRATYPAEAEIRVGDVTAVRVLHVRGSSPGLHARR